MIEHWTTYSVLSIFPTSLFSSPLRRSKWSPVNCWGKFWNNKAGYTTTTVGCMWVGKGSIRVSREFGHNCTSTSTIALAVRLKTTKTKSSKRRTNQRTDGQTVKVGCSTRLKETEVRSRKQPRLFSVESLSNILEWQMNDLKGGILQSIKTIVHEG